MREVAGGITRDRPDLLPILLKLLEPGAGPEPIARSGEGFGLFDERRLLLKVQATFLAQPGEVAFTAAANEVRGRAKALPEPLRGVPWRLGDFLPLGVQLAQRARGGDQVRVL